MGRIIDQNWFDGKFTSTELVVVKILFRRSLPLNLSGIDNDELLSYSAKNGVAALLYNTLTTENILSNVPEEIRSRLKNEYLRTLVQNTNLLNKAQDINAILTENGISPLFLKGILLAPFCYKDPALRPMSDIDLLVPEQDVYRAYDILLNKGAVRADEIEKDHPANHHMPMIIFKGAPVEVHRFLTPKESKYFIPPDDVFARKINWSNRKYTLSGPASPDLFIYMIIHVYYTFIRGGMRLSWMYDFLLMREFVDTGSSEFRERVERWEVEYPVCFMLTLLDLLAGKEPSAVEWRGDKKLLQDISLAAGFLHEQPEDSVLYSYRLIWEQIKNTHGIDNKLKIFRTKLFRRSDENLLMRLWKLVIRFTGMFYNSIKLNMKRFTSNY